MTTKTKPPTLMGKPVRLSSDDTCFLNFGSLDVLFIKWSDGSAQSQVGGDSKNFRSLPAAVRWAEGRVLATLRALEKVRGK